jgi:hypothetical protein
VVRLLTDGMSIDIPSDSDISSDDVASTVDRVLRDLDLSSYLGPAGIRVLTAAKPPSAKVPVSRRRPPVQLVVLVIIWLVLIIGPVAGEKLPNEIQTLLSTEVGTVALGIAITQMMSQKRK